MDPVQEVVEPPTEVGLDRPPSQKSTPGVEESEGDRIERLGRERPAQFKTIWAEILFIYSILASQFMAVSPRSQQHPLQYSYNQSHFVSDPTDRNTLSQASTSFFPPSFVT